MANKRKYSDGTKLGNHCVYRLQYHLVFVVKYRRPCITGEMGEFLVENADRILRQWQGCVLEGKSDRDHIHLLVEMHPKYGISKYIGVLKQTLSRLVRQEFPDEVNRYLWGGRLLVKEFLYRDGGRGFIGDVEEIYRKPGGLIKKEKAQFIHVLAS